MLLHSLGSLSIKQLLEILFLYNFTLLVLESGVCVYGDVFVLFVFIFAN